MVVLAKTNVQLASHFQLSNDERLAIAKRVSEKVAGRVPVVAGGMKR